MEPACSGCRGLGTWASISPAHHQELGLGENKGKLQGVAPEPQLCVEATREHLTVRLEPMKDSLLYIWLIKEALWLDSTSFLQSPTAGRLRDLQTGKGTNEGQSCQSEEQKMACIAGVAWDVA